MRALCSVILCMSAFAEMSDKLRMYESEPEYKYIFFHGGLNFIDVYNEIDISLEEQLTSEYTMAVEARGWKRTFAKG